MAGTTAAAQTGGTNPFVAGQATKPQELPMDQAVLIGTMGKDGDMTALFRSSGGRVHVLKEGDVSPLGRIIEISQAGVVVERMTGNAKFLPPIPVG